MPGRIRGQLVAVWLVTAAVLGSLLVSSARDVGPLDDPDLAKQRSGMLDVVGPRSAAPLVVPGMPAAGWTGVVFFLRPSQLDEMRAMLKEKEGKALAASAGLAVVVSVGGAGPDERIAGAYPLVGDPDCRLADGYRMRRPRDDGPPVGYAIVGPDGTVRFRTEDPGVAKRLDEVLILVKAVR